CAAQTATRGPRPSVRPSWRRSPRRRTGSPSRRAQTHPACPRPGGLVPASRRQASPNSSRLPFPSHLRSSPISSPVLQSRRATQVRDRWIRKTPGLFRLLTPYTNVIGRNRHRHQSLRHVLHAQRPFPDVMSSAEDRARHVGPPLWCEKLESSLEMHSVVTGGLVCHFDSNPRPV